MPTEAEWEYAARGGNSPSWAIYGPLGRIAWYRGNSGGMTHRVALKQPNNYGLYDMLGNVDEWVADYYCLYSNIDTATTPVNSLGVPEVSPPAQPMVRAFSRVVRGASWANDAKLVSASNRFRYDPSNRHQNVGFRCAGN